MRARMTVSTMRSKPGDLVSLGRPWSKKIAPQCQAVLSMGHDERGREYLHQCSFSDRAYGFCHWHQYLAPAFRVARDGKPPVVYTLCSYGVHWG